MSSPRILQRAARSVSSSKGSITTAATNGVLRRARRDSRSCLSLSSSSSLPSWSPETAHQSLSYGGAKHRPQTRLLLLLQQPHYQHHHQRRTQPFSCLAVQWEHEHDDDDEHDEDGDELKKSKHCKTCTCDSDPKEHPHKQPHEQQQQHHHGHLPQQQDQPNWLAQCTLYAPPSTETEPLPPPLPEPKFTFLRRVIKDPTTTIAVDSAEGRQRLLRSLQNETAHSYFALQNHFCNQSDPAYCGVTTLLIVLNAFCVDPLRRWKGGWRYFGHEDLILANCCLDPERVRRVGIDMGQFAQLASCQGLLVQLKRAAALPQPNETNHNNEPQQQQQQHHATAGSSSLDEFRSDIKRVLTTAEHIKASHNSASHHSEASTNELNSLLVVSYARSALGQTGDGHFAPIAAYDEPTDSVLLLDVARFKYPSAWVTVKDLYRAMKPMDPVTNTSRGWLVLEPPERSAFYQGSHLQHEAKRAVEQVPAMTETDRCPAHAVKVEFCPNHSREQNNNLQ